MNSNPVPTIPTLKTTKAKVPQSSWMRRFPGFELKVLHRVRHLAQRSVDVGLVQTLSPAACRGVDERLAGESSRSPGWTPTGMARAACAPFTEHSLDRILTEVAPLAAF
nr:hypothetical protein [uncultured Shinella sp.]